MFFQTKNILKNNHNYTPKHPLKPRVKKQTKNYY
jgi:hypothetical protein